MPLRVRTDGSGISEHEIQIFETSDFPDAQELGEYSKWVVSTGRFTSPWDPSEIDFSRGLLRASGLPTEAGYFRRRDRKWERSNLSDEFAILGMKWLDNVDSLEAWFRLSQTIHAESHRSVSEL